MYRINDSFDIMWEACMHFPLSDHFDNVLTGTSNDRGFYTGLFLSYKIGKKDNRHLRWTYRGQNIDILGRKKKDPMVTEITLLEDDVRKYEENRPVKIHNIEITTTETYISKPLYIRTIFFFFFGDKKFSDTNIIKDEELAAMAEVVVQLRYHPEATLYVYGYVDENDPNDHEEISRKECEKIVDYLSNVLGGNSEQMKICPIGSSQPIATGSEVTKELKEKSHRRVDLVLEL
jgi:outer membrane protein OmpA-like peptidoglycan-associated protein